MLSDAYQGQNGTPVGLVHVEDLGCKLDPVGLLSLCGCLPLKRLLFFTQILLVLGFPPVVEFIALLRREGKRRSYRSRISTTPSRSSLLESRLYERLFQFLQHLLEPFGEIKERASRDQPTSTCLLSFLMTGATPPWDPPRNAGRLLLSCIYADLCN